MSKSILSVYDVIPYKEFSSEKALAREIQPCSKGKYLLDNENKMLTLTKICVGNYNETENYVVARYLLYECQLEDETYYNHFAGRYYKILPSETTVRYCDFKVCSGERLNKIVRDLNS